MTLEQFEIGFMRDADAEGEVALWERIAAALDKASIALPDLDREMILRTPQEQANPDVQRVI